MLGIAMKGTRVYQELQDEIQLNAPIQEVYDALNDPEILQKCIPGCEEIIKHSDTELEAKVLLKIGPVKARFKGNVVLDHKDGSRLQFLGRGTGRAICHDLGDPYRRDHTASQRNDEQNQ